MKIMSQKKVGFEIVLFTLIITFSIGAMEAMTQVKEEQILAKVGNYFITHSDLAEMVNKYQGLRKDKPYTLEEKKVILDNLIKMVVIIQEAERLKLEKKPSVESKLKLSKNEILMREYVESQIRPQIKITDQEVKDFLSQTPELVPRETRTLMEIVVKTEKEAKEIVEALKKGASFSKLAAEKSIADSKIRGGRLGIVPRGRLSKDLEDVAFKLKVGEFSTPVKTDNGYAILYLEAMKERTQKEVEDLEGKVKVKIEQYLKDKKTEEIIEKKVEELSKNIKIEKHYDKIK